MIRALSVIGHGVNILPHFLTHYSEYVDEIQLVVYESDLHKNLFDDVSKIASSFPKAKIVKKIYDRVFDWEKVTSLYNFIKNDNPNDWWVVADVDEFHLYPNDDINSLISVCDEYGWDLVRGGFIDRIGPDGEFSEISSKESIFRQFPNMGYFRYPLSGANPNKICVMKGYVELTNGQHYAKINGHTTWKWQGWNHPLINPTSFVQVHHFKWDKTSGDRIMAVADVNKEYAFSSEYKKMYKTLVKMRFKININNPDFMFNHNGNYGRYYEYQNWNKLIKKITSI
jgi:hypothetical protein